LLIPKGEFFRLVAQHLLPILAAHGFAANRAFPGLYCRQRGPFLDMIRVDRSRFGEFAYLTVDVWVPWFDAAPIDLQGIDPDLIGVHVGGEVSPRAIRERWGWDVANSDEVERTLKEMARAVALLVVPWFDAISSTEAFMNECAANISFWRRVRAADRTRIQQNVDKTLSGAIAVDRYGFVAKAGRAKREKARPSTAEPLAGNYEAVTFVHTNEAVPHLRLKIEGVRKKPT
jgi:hypothetical protein